MEKNGKSYNKMERKLKGFSGAEVVKSGMYALQLFALFSFAVIYIS